MIYLIRWLMVTSRYYASWDTMWSISQIFEKTELYEDTLDQIHVARKAQIVDLIH